MFTLPDAILLPVAGHLLLVFFLFAAVSIQRQKAVHEKIIELDDLAKKDNEPEHSRRWVNNLNNQFEVPVLFYAIVAMLFATGSVTELQVGLAWLFLIGRVLHSVVQVSGDNVQLRGVVFTMNFLAVFAMWALFLLFRWGLL